jgi:predicted Zn finger-like uncharacterized protein
VSKVHINCPQCQKGYRIDDSHIGETRNCKNCNTKFTVLVSYNQSTDREQLVKNRSQHTNSPSVWKSTIWLENNRNLAAFCSVVIFFILFGLYAYINSPLRYQEIIKLGNMGPDAKEYIPELVRVLSLHKENVRIAAANALEKIDPEWRTSEIAKNTYSKIISEICKGVDYSGNESKFNDSKRYPLDIINPDWENSREVKSAIPALVSRLSNNYKHYIKTEGISHRKIPGSDFTVNVSDTGAANSLKLIGPVAVPQLIHAIEARGGGLNTHVVNLLRGMGPVAKDAIPELVTQLSKLMNPHFQIRLRETLDDIDPNWIESDVAKKALPVLIYNLSLYNREGDENLRKTLRETLYKIDPVWRTIEVKEPKW